ncbi:lipoprotein [Streptomyces flaveus]|uniref:Lipoprotein n=2 Tax=Streptomyces flaveus TaxID=66370 RepID=A0A917QDM7_9ACTN|nr:lipoprotein [Streptomyces flaveus]
MGVVGCEPGDGINSAAVAITTDQVGTQELERQGVDVRWVSCTASYGDSATATAGGSPSARSVATVDCVGEDKDGRDITIKGKVTQEVDGKCVRGDLTARVGGKEWFRVDVLGNCDAADPTTPAPAPTPSGDDHGSTPPVDHETTPPDDHGTTPPNEQPGPTVTVTVTTTVTVRPSPTCSCHPGK